MNDTAERATLLRQLGWSEELIAACLPEVGGRVVVVTPPIAAVVVGAADSSSVVLEVTEPAVWSGIRIQVP